MITPINPKSIENDYTDYKNDYTDKSLILIPKS